MTFCSYFSHKTCIFQETSLNLFYKNNYLVCVGAYTETQTNIYSIRSIELGGIELCCHKYTKWMYDFVKDFSTLSISIQYFFKVLNTYKYKSFPDVFGFCMYFSRQVEVILIFFLFGYSCLFFIRFGVRICILLSHWFRSMINRRTFA